MTEEDGIELRPENCEDTRRDYKKSTKQPNEIHPLIEYQSMLHHSYDIRTCITFLTAFVIDACHALHCGDTQCGADQRCCHGNGSAPTVRCCKLPQHTFFDNVGWITRKLSGILILLLLFAMGYFIQRIICPRPRRHHERPEEPSSLFHGHTTASQDSLLDRFPEYSVGDFTSPVLQLPAYDEVKYLPTYEETMQEVDGHRSDDNLLASSRGPASVTGTAVGAREERRATSSTTRTTRNSV